MPYSEDDPPTGWPIAGWIEPDPIVYQSHCCDKQYWLDLCGGNETIAYWLRWTRCASLGITCPGDGGEPQ